MGNIIEVTFAVLGTAVAVYALYEILKRIGALQGRVKSAEESVVALHRVVEDQADTISMMRNWDRAGQGQPVFPPGDPRFWPGHPKGPMSPLYGFGEQDEQEVAIDADKFFKMLDARMNHEDGCSCAICIEDNMLE